MTRVLAITLALALSPAAVPATAQLAAGPKPVDAAPRLAAPDSALAAALASASPVREAAPGFLPLPKYGTWVSVTKWFALAAAVGLGTIAAVVHEQAEDAFAELEQLCLADPDNCRDLTADGAYADPQLESLFQEVVSKDRTTRWSLIGAEVSFGASVLLFIVDFQKKRGPGDIPYDPDSGKSKLRLTALPGEVALRYYFR